MTKIFNLCPYCQLKLQKTLELFPTTCDYRKKALFDGMIDAVNSLTPGSLLDSKKVISQLQKIDAMAEKKNVFVQHFSNVKFQIDGLKTELKVKKKKIVRFKKKVVDLKIMLAAEKKKKIKRYILVEE